MISFALPNGPDAEELVKYTQARMPDEIDELLMDENDLPRYQYDWRAFIERLKGARTVEETMDPNFDVYLIVDLDALGHTPRYDTDTSA